MGSNPIISTTYFQTPLDRVAFLLSRRSSEDKRARTGAVVETDIEDAFRKTVRENERVADESGLKRAVEEIAGFPFLMQLVGYRARDASPESQTISSSDFEQGIDNAQGNAGSYP